MAITEHWRVEVFADSKQILAIEPEMLAGADITDDYADTIRHCARHLMSFVGTERQSDFLNDPHNAQSNHPGTCNYPDCNCPFDAPADHNWCARGLPHNA